MEELKRRMGPFLALLDALYMPLLFAIAPQAYAVYRWLYDPASPESEWVAVMGALGYEFVYVGAIAWADRGERTRWTGATAVIALIFSVAVAVYVYRHQQAWAVLHAGFPLVAFCYTMQMHAGGRNKARRSVPAPAHVMVQEGSAMIPSVPQLAHLEPLEDETTIVVAEQRYTWRRLAAATGVPVSTLRRKLAQDVTEEADV